MLSQQGDAGSQRNINGGARMLTAEPRQNATPSHSSTRCPEIVRPQGHHNPCAARKGTQAAKPSRKIDEVLERAEGIEPTYAAWEAAVLPLNYARNAWLANICACFFPACRLVFIAEK